MSEKIGNISVIKFPVVNSYHRFHGDWKYVNKIMYKRALFKRLEIDVRKTISRIELDEGFLTTVAQYQEAEKFTPEYGTVLLAAPALAESYQARRRKKLSSKAFAFMEVNGNKEDMFYAYMDSWVFDELYDLIAKS